MRVNVNGADARMDGPPKEGHTMAQDEKPAAELARPGLLDRPDSVAVEQVEAGRTIDLLRRANGAVLSVEGPDWPARDTPVCRTTARIAQ
jgi:hypothetical protein